MRTIYLCRACAATYLPPESMRYEQVGLDASPVHCSRCQTTGRDLIDAATLPDEVFRAIAARFEAEQLRREAPERQITRSTGPRRRARSGPASARWRLG